MKESTGAICLVVLALSAFCFIFYPVIFSDMEFFPQDSMNSRAMRRGLDSLYVQTGERPLWNPYIFGGMPSAESFTNIDYLYFPSYLFKYPGLLFILIGLCWVFRKKSRKGK